MAKGNESLHGSGLTPYPQPIHIPFAYQKHYPWRIYKMHLSLRIFHFTFNKTIVITSIDTHLPGPMLCALYILHYLPPHNNPER